jgi:hypothetical protein
MKKIGSRLKARILDIAENSGINLRRNYYATKITPSKELIQWLFTLRPVDMDLDLIRLGSEHDGGYVIPENLDSIKLNISPGCNSVWQFEKDLYLRFGIPSILLDKPEAKPDNLFPPTTFLPFWVGTYDDTETLRIDSLVEQLFLGSLKMYDSNGQVISLKEGEDNALMMQMDIENAEWNVLSSLSKETLNLFKVLVIEFHNLRYAKNYLIFKTLYQPVIAKLLESFSVINANGNNNCSTFQLGDKNIHFPDTVELTLVKKGTESPKPPQYSKLEILNMPNVVNKPPITIPWERMGKLLNE